MEVRLLKPEEHFEANLISIVAFHMKMEDPEKNREESLKSQDEDWGAFSEDGKVMARIINNHYETRLDGQRVRNGQPEGAFSGLGISPISGIRLLARAVFGSGAGTAEIRALL